MHWTIVNIYKGIHNVYSGWIWWNLFLAFIPMLLSFMLFRPKAIPAAWLKLAWFITALIGVIGFSSRISRLFGVVYRTYNNLQAGNVDTLLKLLWLGVVVIAVGVGFWALQRSSKSKVWRWWVGVVIFVVFLPNAPYVLTDIIHLIRGASAGTIKIWVIALVFIPIHLGAMVIGFEAYVLSLLNVSFYLQQRALNHLVMPVEMGLHALCAFGIFLGRFSRLNSWDLAIDPTSVLLVTLNSLTQKRPIATMVATFVILALFYWLMKQITLGLKLRFDYARKGLDPLL
jgi:uncharacterized membrane protein